MLRIMALLTINVGLFNLFPIPALDGWRLFLLIFEGIFKRKMPDKWEWVINAVGLALLLALMCFITFSDITKLI
jgi:regulator of sigma E protease